ncbi:MAG: exodeoxyribonuclease III [Deltaproteobacteria bacterium]|nr:exodeoxyribonuclease III [Deltaproteobacteria bacterium]
MKIVSWNVNGIRACAKKGLVDFVKQQNADIFCIQETKAQLDQVSDDLKNLGYENFLWSSAKKKGYSGVATFSKKKPLSWQTHFGYSEYEEEGRTILSDFGDFILYNIYFPNGGSGEERHHFKQIFLKRLNKHLKDLVSKGKQLIVVGDYNVAHRHIDVYDPIRLATVSGFLPEERKWFDDFLEIGFEDTFRKLNPNTLNKYSWWSYRELARISNRGWRIDYICSTKDLNLKLRSSAILDDIEGSDHCPVVANYT